MSVIVGRKRFHFSKYGCVLLLVIGVTLFLYKPAKEETSKVCYESFQVVQEAVIKYNKGSYIRPKKGLSKIWSTSRRFFIKAALYKVHWSILRKLRYNGQKCLCLITALVLRKIVTRDSLGSIIYKLNMKFEIMNSKF